MSLTQQSLETLVEFAQDNKGNQLDIVDAQVCITLFFYFFSAQDR
jgi:hypothetical protein